MVLDLLTNSNTTRRSVTLPASRDSKCHVLFGENLSSNLPVTKLFARSVL